MSVYIYLAIGAVLLYLYLRSSKTKGSLAGVPGPKGLPLVGNYFNIWKRPLHLVIRDWSLKYGPVFKYNIFGREMLAVSGNEALREMLLTKGQDFGGRPNLRRDLAKKLSRQFPGRGIVGADISPYLGSVRKQVHGALKLYGSGVAHFDDNIGTVLDELIQTLESKGQQPFDCYDDLHDTLAAFICTLISGKRVTRTDPSAIQTKKIDLLQRRQNAISPGRIIISQFPWLLNFYQGHTQGTVESQKQFFIFWNNFILPIKDTEEFKAGRGLLAEMCKLQQKQQQQQHINGGVSGGVDHEGKCVGDVVTDDDLNMIIRNIVVAGIITTTSSLYALLNIMLHYPDVQDKIAEEVASKIEPDQNVTMAHKTELPYTRAVVLELLRVTSIAPHALLHKTMVDTQLQGYSVPKDTIVMPCLYIHHNNNKEWDEPLVFKPERFLGEDGTLLPADDPVRKKMLAFGLGPRVCLGDLLAQNRLFVFAASMMRKFRFLPPEGEPLVSCHPNDWSTALVFEPNRYQLRAVPRNE